MKKYILILVALLPFVTFAQSEREKDFGVIASAEISAPLGSSFDVTVEEELRFIDNCAQFDRWLNSVGVEYTFMYNKMKARVMGDYIRRFNDKGYYENRGRVGAQLTYSETYHHFKFAFRSKLIATYRDERTGEYRVNPKLYWRNRILVAYQLPNSRYKYSLSTELHWLVNDPKNRIVDNLRTVATVEYRLSRRQYLSAFLRMDNDLQVAEPVDRFFLGMTYSLKY